MITNPLRDKRVILGVTGSIASYKSLDLASKLVQSKAKVDVILTKSATKFISPMAFESITNSKVFSDIFDTASPQYLNHIRLAESANIMIIAPATANTIAKLATGICDDALGTTVLASKAPLVVAPAMDGSMFNHPATQENISKLISRGVFIAGPAKGRLASGLYGYGRLVKTQDLLGVASMILGSNGDLKDRKIVVTAGGTQESIDPVRIITNRSSGKMGYAIATAARDRGAQVTLISGPSALENPVGIFLKKVDSASEMKSELDNQCLDADAVIMAAAVSDWKPKKFSINKIKKTNEDYLTIDFTKNADIIGNISRQNLVKVGFAAESENLIENAKAKIASKDLDLIVANDITAKDSGFASDTNRATLIHASGTTEKLPLMEKYDVANAILDQVVIGLKSKQKSS